MCGVITAGLTGLNGQTVRQVLAIAHTALGGGSTGYNIPTLSTFVGELNAAFLGGSVSPFAQEHLVNGPCPCTPGTPGCPWQTGDAFTRTQAAWNDSTSWYAAYDSVYASTFGEVEVGIPGTAGFSMRFSAPDFVSEFFIQSGLPAALTADLFDPTSSSSRGFGGEALALRLNLDFSAAGALGGSVTFGTLRLCAMSDASLNNKTVNEVMGIANTLLGGGSNGYGIVAIADLVGDLNISFIDGVPSTFAQEHLVNGPCP